LYTNHIVAMHLSMFQGEINVRQCVVVVVFVQGTIIIEGKIKTSIE